MIFENFMLTLLIKLRSLPNSHLIKKKPANAVNETNVLFLPLKLTAT